MKRSIEKDKKKRLNYLKQESLRRVLKAITYNNTIKLNVRKKAFLAISALPKSSSIVQLKNRCVLTGRGRSVLGGFRISRMTISKLAKMGIIPGLRMSSW